MTLCFSPINPGVLGSLLRTSLKSTEVSVSTERTSDTGSRKQALVLGQMTEILDPVMDDNTSP